MSVNIIDTIKPKNGGTFPVVEAVDVAVANNQRLDVALAGKANQTDFNTLSNTVANIVVTKANQSTVDSLNTKVLANEHDIDVQTARIDSLASLEEGSTTGDAELMDIRVKTDGTSASSAGDAVREQIEAVESANEAVNISTNAEKPEIFRESTNVDAKYIYNDFYVAAKVSANTYISGLRIKWTGESTYNFPILILSYDGTDYTVEKKIEVNAAVVNDYVDIPLSLLYNTDVYIAIYRFYYNSGSVIGNGDTLGYVHKFEYSASYDEGDNITPVSDASTLYYGVSVLGGNYKGVNKRKTTQEQRVMFSSAVNLWNESCNPYLYYKTAAMYYVLAKVEANNYISGIRMQWDELSYTDMILVLTYDGTKYKVVDTIFPDSVLENGYIDIPVNKTYASTVYFAFKKFKWTDSSYGTGDALGYSHKFENSQNLKKGETVTPTVDPATIYSGISIYGVNDEVKTRYDGDDNQGAYSNWFKPENLLISNPILNTVASDKIAFIGRWFKRKVNGVECMATTNCGSQILFKVRNASTITINFEPTTETNAYYAYAIDNSEFTRMNIEDNTFSIYGVEGITKEHTIRIFMDGIAESIQKWQKGNGFAISSISSDGAILGCKTTDPIIAFYGDSITEGIRALGITPTEDMGDTNSATGAFPFFCAQELNAVPYYVGYGATGIVSVGSYNNLLMTIDTVMQYKESKPYYPTLIVINHGTNDRSVTDEVFTARYKEDVRLLHRKYPAATILCMRPFNGTHGEQVQAVANTYDYCHYIDTTGWNPETADGTHPTAAGAADAGHRLAEAIKDIIY